MNPTSESPKNATVTPLSNIDGMIKALGHRTRWKMLKELTCGEPRTITELAKVAGCGYDNASQHLARLFHGGLVERGRGRLYQIPKQYIPTPGQPVLDYGHCLLRLDAV